MVRVCLFLNTNLVLKRVSPKFGYRDLEKVQLKNRGKILRTSFWNKSSPKDLNLSKLFSTHTLLCGCKVGNKQIINYTFKIKNVCGSLFRRGYDLRLLLGHG